MNFAEYLVTFYAIIIGLIVSNFFLGWADMIKYRQTSKSYWAHLTLTIVILLSMVREFWLVYSAFSSSVGRIGDFLKILITPVIYFFSSVLLFPGATEKQGADFDFKEFFFSKIYDLTAIFGVTFIVDLVTFVWRSGLNGLTSIVALINIVGVICCLLIIRFKNRRVIEGVVVVSVGMIAYLYYSMW